MKSKAIAKPMYHDAELYDLKYADKVQDINFYLQHVSTSSFKVLELMCGTGRIAIPLTQYSSKVTGIDSSRAMLHYGREKIARTTLKNITLFERDCRDFSLEEKFHVIILPLNSLAHLVTADDMRKTCDCIKNHLVHGGRFLLDYLNPQLEVLQCNTISPTHAGTYTTSAGRKIALSFTNMYNSKTQINTVHWYYDIDDGKERYIEEMPMRIYFPQELDALLEANGFFIEKKYGNYDRTPFTENSPQQLYICRTL
jgi:SAM-dependent methyltransferase